MFLLTLIQLQSPPSELALSSEPEFEDVENVSALIRSSSSVILEGGVLMKTLDIFGSSLSCTDCWYFAY